jgi:hypothetical protein
VTAREIVNHYLTTIELSEEGEIRSVQMQTRCSLLGDNLPASAE